jgi:hypothetical protein
MVRVQLKTILKHENHSWPRLSPLSLIKTYFPVSSLPSHQGSELLNYLRVFKEKTSEYNFSQKNINDKVIPSCSATKRNGS